MSFGGGPRGNDDSKARVEKLAASADASAGRLGAAIRRWRVQRQLRHADLLERNITARENLRDFKQFTGDRPGQWTGGGV